MDVLVAVAVLIVFGIAAQLWGVDSRDWGRDPVADGRPRRWI